MLGESSDSVDGRRVVDRARSRAFTLPCDPTAVRRLRQLLQHDDVIGRLDPSARTNVLLIASELLTNAISACTGSRVHVVIETGPRSVRIEVRNEGAWLSPPPPGTFRLPMATAGRGRGLAIVSRLAEDLAIEVDGNTTVVSALIRT